MEHIEQPIEALPVPSDKQGIEPQFLLDGISNIVGHLVHISNGLEKPVRSILPNDQAECDKIIVALSTERLPNVERMPHNQEVDRWNPGGEPF
jgi:hypothetical protein